MCACFSKVFLPKTVLYKTSTDLAFSQKFVFVKNYLYKCLYVVNDRLIL